MMNDKSDIARTDTSPYAVPHRAISDERKRIYLRVLAETGSHPAAARAASPHLADSPGPRPGYSSFADLRRTDAEFAKQCDEAERLALGKVEAAITERAFTLDERPIFDRNGNRLGVQTDSRPANAMLLRLAERLAPEDWAPRKQQSLTAEHTHEHRHRHEVVFELRAEHIALLPEQRRHQFVSDLHAIRAALEQQENPNHEQPQLAAPAGQTVGELRGPAASAGDGDERADSAGR